MYEFINELLRKNIFKNFSKVFSANVLNRGLLFLIYYMLADGLTVEEYGVFTISISLISTLSNLTNLGFSVTITRFCAIFIAENKKNRIRLLFSSVNNNLLIIGLFVFIIGAIFSGQISGLLFSADYSSLVLVSLLGVPIVLIYSSYSALLTGLENYTVYFFHQLLPNICLILFVTYGLYVAEFSVWNLNLAFSIAPLSFIILFLFSYRSYNYWKPAYYSIKMLSSTFEFSKWITLQTVLLIIQSRLDTYLLAIFTDTTQVSYYDIAFKFQGLILFVVGSLNTVLQPRISKLKDKVEIVHFVKKIRLIPLAVNVVIIFSIFAVPFLIELLFDSKYDNSIFPLQIMLLAVGVHVWIMPFNSALYAFGKSKVFFVAVVLQLIVNLLVSSLLLPKFGAVGASISYLSINIVALCCSLYYYSKYLSRK